MAMELLDGDLKHAIAQRTMTLDAKLDVIEQILEGLNCPREGIVAGTSSRRTCTC
ncbi:MAG: hypothetical protein U0599_06760 [Vicinamibacteria bacterium]